MNTEMKEINRGDVFFADLGEPIGGELGYRRPVIVIKRNVMQNNTVIVAIVSGRKFNSECKSIVRFLIDEKTPEMSVLLEHVRTIDISRLGRPIGNLFGEEFEKIKAALLYALGLDEEDAE